MDEESGLLDGQIESQYIDAKVFPPIFTEPIWRRILNCFKNKKDICAVLLAIPELDILFHHEKVNWMIDQILPHLATKYLVKRRIIKGLFSDITWKHSLNTELLNLRLVSKEWKRAVDLTLQNHADRRPPHLTDNGDTEQVQVPKNHLNYNKMTNFRFGVTVFETGKGVEKFIQQMCAHDSNPFPGKSVYLCPYVNHHFDFLVEKCVELFERFGKYVNDLEIDLKFDEDDVPRLNICKNILKCLHHTTQLKTLTFTGIDNGGSCNPCHYFIENRHLFPDLPQLKTFEWRVHFKYANTKSPGLCFWNKLIICKYSRGPGIRKLVIDQHAVMSEWCANRLSNLTELHLQLDNDDGWSNAKLGTILKMINNKSKLQIFGLTATKHCDPLVNITDFLEVLAPFGIRDVILEDVKLEEKPLPLFAKMLRSSSSSLQIKSLYLHDSLKLTYDFLKMLPNLETLHIYFNKNVEQDVYKHLKLMQNPEQTLGIKLKKYFQMSGSSSRNILPIAKRLRACILGAYINDPDVFNHLESIWKELSNLKILAGSVETKIFVDEYHYGVWDVRFSKECGNKVFLEYKPNWPKFISFKIR